MADNHEHRLEMVTSYGNGFARYRCTESGCDYWTDGREDERTDEVTHLRAEVAQLTLARDTAVHSFTFNYKRANAAEAEVARLSRELDDAAAFARLLAENNGALRAQLTDALGAIELGAGFVQQLQADLARTEHERDTNSNWPAMYRMYEEQVSTEKVGRRNAEALAAQLVGALNAVSDTRQFGACWCQTADRVYCVGQPACKAARAALAAGGEAPRPGELT